MGGQGNGCHHSFMNAIERYLQAQSKIETLAHYYSYPLLARPRPTPTVQPRSLGTSTVYMAISIQEMDEALSPRNTPKRSTAIPFRVSGILAKSTDGRIHD